jgi:hypothetical protein
MKLMALLYIWLRNFIYCSDTLVRAKGLQIVFIIGKVVGPRLA